MTTRLLLPAALLFCLAGSANAAPPTATPTTASNDSLSFVTIQYRDRAQLQSLASRFQHMIVDRAANTLRPNKPPMVLFGSIHAREYTPAELSTRFAEWLVNGYGTDAEATWLMDNYTFYLVLQANPDGRKKAETGLSWRKNVNNSNGSCSATSVGTDLNRNFPFHWNTVAGGSSGNACTDTYRGPVPQSEPETQHLMRLVAVASASRWPTTAA